MMKKFGVFIFVIGIFLISSGAVRAQYYDPSRYSNPVIQKMHYNQMMTTKAIGGLIQGHMIAGSGKGTKGRSTRRSAVKADPLTFRPANVTVISKQELEKMADTEAEREQISQLFNGAVKSYAQIAGKDGFPFNDLAYAFNFFVVNNYHIYKNVYGKYKGYKEWGVVDFSQLPDHISLTDERTIYNQFREVLSSNPSVGKLTDAEKEKFTALMAIMSGVPFKMYEAGLRSGNDEMIRNAQTLAKQNLENLFGTSAENIVVNSSGVTVNGN